MSSSVEPLPAGTPCWPELATADPVAARSLFTSLLGWQYRDADAEDYVVALVDGAEVAAITALPPGRPQSGWTIHLASDDCDATCDAVVRAGGTVVSPPADVGDLGRVAVVTDPTSSSFAVWQAGTRRGAAPGTETGRSAWTELMTRDYAGSRDFYAAVFGYHYTEITSGDTPYSLVEVGGRPVCGLGVIPSDVPPQIPPHWRVFFAVEDAAAATAQMIELGGMRRRPPADAPYGYHIGLGHPLAGGFAVITPAPL